MSIAFTCFLSALWASLSKISFEKDEKFFGWSFLVFSAIEFADLLTKVIP